VLTHSIINEPPTHAGRSALILWQNDAPVIRSRVSSRAGCSTVVSRPDSMWSVRTLTGRSRQRLRRGSAAMFRVLRLIVVRWKRRGVSVVSPSSHHMSLRVHPGLAWTTTGCSTGTCTW